MEFVKEQLKDPVQTVQDLSELAAKVRGEGKEGGVLCEEV